jgi:class 3 adenylate cyclase/tetratricopeptide (TPR) repeat protein
MTTQTAGIQCSKCLSINTMGAKFCQNCGQPLGRACPSCGSMNLPEAKYCNQCGTRLAADPWESDRNGLNRLQQSTPQSLREKIFNAKARMEGERKPVAILFTDIVDSTSIAERLDPEDWRDIITGAHQLVSQVVYRYEGTIAQLLGDGVLAFFGAPITHEDDPLRAVRAGLEIQEAIQVYQQKIKQVTPIFKMRVGVNTGLVVVGNIGDDLHMEYQAIGDAVNLAARLQSLAYPGKVLISESTCQCLPQTIECSDLGLVNVKGKAEPVRVYQVERVKDQVASWPAVGRVVVPLVGREKELSQLQDLTAAVGAGIGRAAVITGEPGVGKSRLVSEWRAALGGGEQVAVGWIEGHCVSYGQTIAYHLVNDLLRSMVGLISTTNPIDTRDALQKFVQELQEDDWLETYASLGHILSLPLEEDALVHIRGLDPMTLQRHYVAALQKVLKGRAVQKPLVCLFEDLHWADPSSVEVLIQLLPLTREAPLFFCFTSRPDQDTPGWRLVLAAREKLGAGLAEIVLRPLSMEATGEMVSTLLAANELPEQVKQLILLKSEGNPLFVEEVVRMLLERGALVRENDAWIVQKDLGLLEVPDNLKRLVLSRIDRLEDEPKRVLRVASVIGREFTVKVLEEVYSIHNRDGKQGRMVTNLSTLEYANLVKLATVHPDPRYLFYHALIQEAAYEAMLKADRKILHRSVAETLETIFPDRLDDLAATLGYHFGKGGVRDKAVTYLSRAAESAQTRYANQEAIGLYHAAIELAEQERDNCSQPDFWEEQIVSLRESLGDIQHLVGQHHEARANYKTAITHTHAEDIVRIARLQRKMGNTWIPIHDWKEAMESYQAAEKSLGPQKEENSLLWWQEWLQIQMDLMLLYYWQDRAEEIKLLAGNVRPMIEKYGSPAQRGGFYHGLVLADLRTERYRITEATLADMQAYLSAQGEVNNQGSLAWDHFMEGFVHLWHHDLEIAQNSLQTAFTLACQTGNITIESRISTYLTICYRMRGLVEEARKLAIQSEDMALRAALPEYQATTQANLSWVFWRSGNFVEARKKALNALDQWHKIPAGHASCSFQWTALFPLIAMAILDEQLEQAIEYCQALLDPGQMRLPDPLEEALKKAIIDWEDKKTDEASLQLRLVIDAGKEYGYL